MKNNFEGIYTNSKFDTLDRCEREYAHRYILKTPKDPDYIDPNYFKFGRAFHEILEETNHDGSKFTLDILNLFVAKNDLCPLFERAKLLKCLESYYAFHKKSEINPVKLELTFNNGVFGGIIDTIGISPKDKKWWIVDIKTAAFLDPMKPYLIKKNQQLSFYACFNEEIKDKIYEQIGIELKEFGGFIYRETKKPSERKTKKDLDFEYFYGRLEPVETRENKILASEIDVDKIRSMINRKKNRCEEVVNIINEKGFEHLSSNIGSCIHPVYKSVCKYFNTCHGIAFSDIKELANLDL